jgi:hypothetical protein
MFSLEPHRAAPHGGEPVCHLRTHGRELPRHVHAERGRGLGQPPFEPVGSDPRHVSGPFRLAVVEELDETLRRFVTQPFAQA